MRLLRRGVETAARGWVLVWTWTHPAAGPTLGEALEAELAAVRGWRLAPRLALFALGTPLFARRQAQAESLAATRTAGVAAASTEGRWRGRLREALVWAVLAGWVAAFALFVHSELTTGTFGPDYAPDPPTVSARFYDRDGELILEVAEWTPPPGWQWQGVRDVVLWQFYVAVLAAGAPSLLLAGLLARRWLSGQGYGSARGRSR